MTRRQHHRGKKRLRQWHRGRGEARRWASTTLPDVDTDADPTAGEPKPFRGHGPKHHGDSA